MCASISYWIVCADVSSSSSNHADTRSWRPIRRTRNARCRQPLRRAGRTCRERRWLIRWRCRPACRRRVIWSTSGWRRCPCTSCWSTRRWPLRRCPDHARSRRRWFIWGTACGRRSRSWAVWGTNSSGCCCRPCTSNRWPLQQRRRWVIWRKADHSRWRGTLRRPCAACAPRRRSGVRSSSSERRRCGATCRRC
jgi:hypothetical protein